MKAVRLPAYPRIRGALRLCAKRFRELGAPGCTLWTEAGEEAARDLQADVKETALTAEIEDLAAVQLLDEVLKDGKVEPVEIAALQRARKHAAASAKADAQIREAVV
jgi:hypothetical protein